MHTNEEVTSCEDALSVQCFFKDLGMIVHHRHFAAVLRPITPMPIKWPAALYNPPFAATVLALVLLAYFPSPGRGSVCRYRFHSSDCGAI